MQMYLYRFKFMKGSMLREVKSCISTRNWCKYITKEDTSPRLLNIDKEKLHDNYQMMEITRICKGKIPKNSYFDLKFQTKFKRDRRMEIGGNYRKKLSLKKLPNTQDLIYMNNYLNK